MAEIVAFIVSLENLNPLNTIFVYDCRHSVKSDYRQIIFEWREHSPKNNKNGVEWTAHRILKMEKFKSRDPDDFCEADERLFKILREKQKKVFDTQLKRSPGSYRSFSLLLIGAEPYAIDNFESECHLAIEMDTAQPGENYRPPLNAFCGANGEWQRRIGKSGKSISALLQNYAKTNYYFEQRTTFCGRCEDIGKIPNKKGKCGRV